MTTPEDAPRLRQFRSVKWAATGVARLPHARLLTEHALPVTRRDEFIVDATWNDERPVCEAILMAGTRRIERRPGVALNLGSTWSTSNYAHFVLDTFPRIHLLERTGMRWEDVDWIVVPKFNSACAQRILAELALPAGKILRAHRTRQLAFDEIWQPSYPCADRARHYPEWVPEFYRTRFRFENRSPRRRLYLSRGRGLRSVMNEEEIQPWLRRHGFETVHLGQRSDEPELMASAEAVIAPHGAAMANLVFCQPGTVVVEILPPNWLFPYYYTLSAAAGLRYHAIIGEPGPPGPEDKLPFRIDPAKLARVGEQALKRESAAQPRVKPL
jgi:capsular polysaccharide biosynthesis protein